MARTTTKKTTAKKKTTRSKASMKIKSAREKAKSRRKRSTRKKKVSVKTVKLVRTTKKARMLAKRALTSAVKGMDIAKVPESIYRKIDSLLVKNADFQNAVQASVVEAANALNKPKKPRKKSAATDEAAE